MFVRGSNARTLAGGWPIVLLKYELLIRGEILK